MLCSGLSKQQFFDPSSTRLRPFHFDPFLICAILSYDSSSIYYVVVVNTTSSKLPEKCTDQLLSVFVIMSIIVSICGDFRSQNAFQTCPCQCLLEKQSKLLPILFSLLSLRISRHCHFPYQATKFKDINQFYSSFSQLSNKCLAILKYS